MALWRKAWYPQAPGLLPRVALKPGGDPNSLGGAYSMSQAQIGWAWDAWAMGPRRRTGCMWFRRRNARSPRRGAIMAHDARARAPIPHPAFRSEVIIAQRAEN